MFVFGVGINYDIIQGMEELNFFFCGVDFGNLV